MLLSEGERLKVIDTKEAGFFEEIYKPYGSNTPEVLTRCDELSAGDKVVALCNNNLLFAGTIRGRPYGFLPHTVMVRGLDVSKTESVIIEIPLHYLYFPKDEHYAGRIVGGHGARSWERLGELTLTQNQIDDDLIRKTTLLIGEEEIITGLNTTDTKIENSIGLLLSIEEDEHEADGPFSVKYPNSGNPS